MQFFLAFSIIFLALSIIVAAFFIFLAIIRSRYKSFALSHSEALHKLEQIKKNYTFEEIPNFDMEHCYDNVNFFRDISMRDYLTYELVYKQKQIKKACKDAESNMKALEKFKKEADANCEFGKYDVETKVRFKKMLDRIESNLYERAFPKPTTHFKIRVTLRLTNINGARIRYKDEVFKAEQIIDLIRRINQKSGNFYTNKDIFDAIARVERGKVTNRMRFAIYHRDGNRCKKCGSRYNLEVDHIIPISKGGKSTMNNLQTLCHRCNVEKGSKIE